MTSLNKEETEKICWSPCTKCWHVHMDCNWYVRREPRCYHT